MLYRLIALFVIVPIVELAVLIEIGRYIGFWPTIGIICLTGVLGSLLTRTQGLAVWHQLNTKLQQGQLPGNELVDGLIILISGAMLLTPGIITDFAGFLGLLPLTRTYFRKYLQKRFKDAQLKGTASFSTGFYSRSTPPDSPENAPEDQWKGVPKKHPDYQSGQ